MGLGIIVENGSVSASELLIALGSYDGLVFALTDTAHARDVAPLLSGAGTVVQLVGDARLDAECLSRANVSGIVSFGDRGVMLGAKIAEEMGLPFNSVATANALTDKYRQRALLAEAGVGRVDCRLILSLAEWDDSAADLCFPLVIKPRNGAGSRNTMLVQDVSAGRAMVSNLLNQAGEDREPALVAEEYLSGVDMTPYGDFVSVESICSGKSVQHVGVTGKLPLLWPFRESGDFYPAPLSESLLDSIKRLTTEALRALGVTHCVTHTEIKLTATGPRIIEVNGRVGGHMTDLYNRSLGVDLIRAAADLALGASVEPEIKECSETYFMYFSQPPVNADRLVRIEGTRSLRGQRCVDSYHSYYRPGDKLPDDMRTANLDRVSGRSSSPGEMIKDINHAISALTYEFTGNDGDIVLDGVALMQYNMSFHD